MLADVLQVGLSIARGGSLTDSIGIIMLAAAGLMFIGGRIFRAEQDVQRRIQGAKPEKQPAFRKNMDHALAAIGTRLSGNGSALDVKVLRGKLIRAGYHGPQAVVIFFAIRLLFALVFALAVGAVAMLWTTIAGRIITLSVIGSGILGYLAPSIALNRLVERNVSEHRDGFPDMMDLMVVCAQAGLSMEAGLQRIAKELAPAYPSLGRNLEWAVREIRSGKPLAKAIESLALRLGLDEAMSFSTLLQQSEELGSSITQSLRAYSDDMRHKRMMKAEEKAYALPAKMVVPLTLFVFPVLFVVILLPVVISVMAARS